MGSKTLMMFGVVAGSTIGGWVPALLGADLFSVWGIVGSVVGGVVGLIGGYQLSEAWID